MSGKRYLLDTNAIIQLLSGNRAMWNIVAEADFLATCVICQLEFLSYPKLDDDTRNTFFAFLSRIAVYDLMASDAELMREVAFFRATSGMKLPDAIIAATAFVNGCDIVTNDAHFNKQSRVAIKTYSLA